MQNRDVLTRIALSASRAAFQTAAWLLVIGITVVAQSGSSTDGSTPLSLTPGSPAGSYPLSGFDNVNLFNGNLNFHLPLLGIAGRGEVKMNMTLPIEQRWRVESIYTQFGDVIYFPVSNWWSGLSAGYGPGVLQARINIFQTDDCNPSVENGPYGATRILTRMTFTSPDGTETELRDQLTGGRPLDTYPCAPGPSRGTVFVSADGTAVTFTSDTTIYENTQPPNLIFYPTGYLSLKDGTRYRIQNGLVLWMRDRNGNQLTFTYDNHEQPQYVPASRVTGITDSLKRHITISYDVQDIQPYGLCDKIEFQGAGGVARTIRISKKNLGSSLRSDFTIKTQYQLFPQFNGSCTNCPFDPAVVSAVWLPDGRSYSFLYNSYGELARATLPTGGLYEYDFAMGISNGPDSGAWSAGMASSSSQADSVYRRMVEKRSYSAANVQASRTRISRPEYSTGCFGDYSCIQTLGFVWVDDLDTSNNLIGRTKHYYFGAAFYADDPVGLGYPGWQSGREYKTESIDLDGNTVLRRSTQTWQQRASVPWFGSFCPYCVWAHPEWEPANDPRITDSLGELLDTSPTQVSRQQIGYDDSVPFNNRNNVKEYDYGDNAPGPLVRETRTTFVTSTNYTAAPVHLRGLVAQASVYDAGGTERSRTTVEYDNHASDANHATLISRSSISGLDGAFTAGNTLRGNVTGTTELLLTDGSVTGSSTIYVQYDVAGNVAKTIDARGFATTSDFSDRFGSPDGDARANSGSLELNTAGQYSYAFPTYITNALGQVSYMQFDYYLGRPVDAEDVNGIVASGYSENESLDRITRVVRSVNQDVSLRAQTTFSYDDVNHLITTTSDQNTFGDGALKTQLVYDGLGRTTEKRSYEGGANYTVTLTQYDSLGRTAKSSNPYRPWNGESAVWNVTAYDAINRVISLTTPDTAIVRTAYSGSESLVTEANGKQRISKANSLGLLKDIWEVTAPDGATESRSFPNHPEVTAGYHTVYAYDGLSNLTSVTQGTQPPRLYGYDSFKRMTSANNPESGTVNYVYDAKSNLVIRTDARGVSTHFSYDALGRASRRWYNGSNSTSATTNNSPALPSGVAASEEINLFYDAQNLPAGSPPGFARGYSIGRLVAVTYGQSSSAGDYFGYNSRGNPVVKIEQVGGINYQTSGSYNNAGARTSATYPSGHTITYGHDQAGRTSSFSGNLGDGISRAYSAGILYSPFGGVSKEQFGTDVPIYNKLFYNVRGQLAEIRESTGYTGPGDTTWNRGAIINHYSFGCWGMCAGVPMPDNNSNLKKQEIYIPSNDQITNYTTWWQQYDYDSLNRIQRVHEYTGNSQTEWQQEYVYDRFGNRTLHPTNTSPVVNRTNFAVIAASNRLGVPNGQPGTMSYDQAGNLTADTYSGGAASRAYDGENRMTSETQAGNNLVGVYTYNADGQRVRRKVNNVETWQVFGLDGELIAEYAVNGSPASPQKEYGYRNGHVLIEAEMSGFLLGGPSGLTAAPSGGGSTLALNWTPASGATNYRVERKSAGGSYGLAGTSSSPAFTDAGVSTGNAYLYKVCAANSQGTCTSDFSNVALGAPFGFTTDPTIITLAEDPTGATVTTVKAAHITQLRTAVNAVRSLAGQSPATWTNPTLSPSVTVITKEDVQDLRQKLDEALSALAIDLSAYTDQPLSGNPTGTSIKRLHISELRLRATRGTGAGSGGGAPTINIQWLVADQLGTPRMIFDKSGTLANTKRHDYLPFGEELNVGTRNGSLGYGTADGIRQKFTEKERDSETGLDWFGPGRYYASVQGRFTSPDPGGAGAKAVNPQTLNRYTYTLNRPTIAIDPDGLSTIVVTVTVPQTGNPTATIYFQGQVGDPGAESGAQFQGLAAGQGRSRMTTDNDTPYGVYTFGGTQGGEETSRLGAGFGTGKVIITGQSGEIITSGRSLIRLHGGGSALGTHAYDLDQDLRATQGCVRMHNRDVNTLIGLINTAASNNDPLDRVFIGTAEVLTNTANQTDQNGNYSNPDLRLAMGLYSNEAERQQLVTADANRRAEIQRQREEEQRQREERRRQRRRQRNPND